VTTPTPRKREEEVQNREGMKGTRGLQEEKGSGRTVRAVVEDLQTRWKRPGEMPAVPKRGFEEGS
jgi:hypothetical protein